MVTQTRHGTHDAQVATTTTSPTASASKREPSTNPLPLLRSGGRASWRYDSDSHDHDSSTLPFRFHAAFIEFIPDVDSCRFCTHNKLWWSRREKYHHKQQTQYFVFLRQTFISTSIDWCNLVINFCAQKGCDVKVCGISLTYHGITFL